MDAAPDWSSIRGRFPGVHDGTYLNTAAEGLWPDRYDHGVERYRAAKSRGSRGRDELAAIEAEARALTAGLLGVESASVAFLASASRGLDALVGSLELVPGENVVMASSEFPAAILAGQRAAERGVEVRLVPPRDGTLDERDIVAQVDHRTRAVVASAVSFITGARLDVASLAASVDRTQTTLIVDGTQAAGIIHVPLQQVDAYVASTYKWMLGPHGLGVLYLNPSTMADRRAPYSGWRGITDLFGPDRLTTHRLHADARRFEEGMPNTLGLAVLIEALRGLESISSVARLRRTRDLTGELVRRLLDLGLPVGPGDPARRSSIVTLQRADAEALVGRLADRGVYAWGRAGVVRFSPYFYNDVSDIDRAIIALAEVWEESA